jgi:YidC/Oxa1 family membrane protein insertase
MFLATKSSMPIIGQVASVMGWIMDAIFKVLDGLFGIQNLGLCIIIFSIIIYALMTPLQIKQQKFSKLSAIMQPELQKVQKKYQGKKDQESMQKMNEETQAIYQKYGVSPTGSCVQLAIQLPILWALWQVIYKIPAYVSSVGDIFTAAVEKISSVEGYTELVQNFITDNKMTRVQLVLENEVATKNSLVDFLYALSPTQWKELAAMDQFSGFSNVIDSTASEISKMQSFLGLNIAEQPWNYIKAAFVGGSIILGIVAVLIPILSWFTQMLNLKLMPQAAQQGGQDSNTMADSMKTMNTVMPLMSAFFCFTFPVGLGIYWVASAVARSVQQVLINRHLNKMDIQDLVNENVKKMEKKREKAGLPPQKITNQAHQNVKNINTTKVNKGASGTNADEKSKKVEESYQKATNAKPGSITAKANMVRDYNERNKK